MLRICFTSIENKHSFLEAVCRRTMVSCRVPKNVVFVLGAPGSGKGAVCEDIVKEFSFKHISVGELLREELNRDNSKHCRLICNYMKSGSIIPSHITCDLLEKAADGADEKNLLIDGFPRNIENMNHWKALRSDKMALRFVLFLECPEQVCIERCIQRGLVNNRLDDNHESLRRRFQVFVRDTMPVIRYYEDQNQLVRVQSDRERKEVAAEVLKIFDDNGFQRRRDTKQ